MPFTDLLPGWSYCLHGSFATQFCRPLTGLPISSGRENRPVRRVFHAESVEPIVPGLPIKRWAECPPGQSATGHGPRPSGPARRAGEGIVNRVKKLAAVTLTAALSATAIAAETAPPPLVEVTAPSQRSAPTLYNLPPAGRVV